MLTASYLAVVLVAISAGVLALVGWQQHIVLKRLLKLEKSIEHLAFIVTTLDDRLLRTSVTQDSMLNDSVRKMQADVKSLEMQLRDTGAGRENPETVDVAIKLVHEGMDADQIVRRTNLPREVVESIVLFHSQRKAPKS
jgi:hypothetical protein